MHKRFEILTESDARALEPGSTVTLTLHGHVTPLAADTLKERRITVVREDQPSSDEASLVPAADIRRLAVASDHTGIGLKNSLVTALRGRGLDVADLGTYTADSVDYPDIASKVAH